MTDGEGQAAPPVALLLTDLVDSAALAERLGDAAMARLSRQHDRMARDLLHQWRGREIDKTDGFLLLFDAAADALGYVLAYHRALAELERPLRGSEGQPLQLRARAGMHVGRVTMRANPAEDVARGAKPFEADGVSKPLAARVMSTALGGQTLITAAARDALGEVPYRVLSHGFWRVAGLPAPLELFEIGAPGAPFTPPPDAAKVYRVVRQDELWMPAREVRHSLPAERDAFVGRHGALNEIARKFDEGARLVSLLGIGGCGKTRIATRFGRVWLGDFPGGAWFCDLAAARTLEGLIYAVAQGLDVPLGGEDPVAQLGRALAGRGPCLVIVDNFEQVARHAEATLGRWLERAADARFLVTTREVLGIAGEEVMALAPLQPADAETLFLRRAAAAKRDFAPSAEDVQAIPRLMLLLDGLPLAIELAAARVRMLTPAALLARMSERFKVLTSAGGRHDRQATLRAAFDWSWDLLRPAEKAALAQLSVFEGGFSLEAAEAIIDLEGIAEAPWSVDVVNSLVDKSFVRPLDNGRFDLLGTVQAYAAEHLHSEGRYPGSGPAALQSAWRRHGAWFAALGPQRAIEARCADLDNLSVACRRAVLAAAAATAAGALDGAWAALSLRGPFRVGVELSEMVCAMKEAPAGDLAQGHRVLGAAWHALGQRGPALAACERALPLAQAAGDQVCESAVTSLLAGLLGRAGRFDEALALHERALDLARRASSPAQECAALNLMGMLRFEQSQMEAAEQHWSTALHQARRIGERRLQGSLLGNLGVLQANRGQMVAAMDSYREALAVTRELGDRQREGNALCNLGMLHQLQGQPQEALRALEPALLVARELGHVRLEHTALCNLGLVHLARADVPRALPLFDAALAVSRETGDARAEGQALGYLGQAHARRGDFAAARVCLGAGRQRLQEVADALSLGVLLCNCAECEALAGDLAAARVAHVEAAALARSTGAGADSELGLALARLQPLLDPALSRSGSTGPA
jgi:predicted ATPase/class 3 adenylate cyclase/tetratricopeptide (TPR) repeat protein